MKTLELKSLKLLNFKGAKEQSWKLIKQTAFHGENRTGKTRLLDAWLWLLFGKDSHGNTAFEIKPLNENNAVINNADVEVSATIVVDNIEHEIGKIYREKWTKPRGKDEMQLTGHETIYTIDLVEKKKWQYKEFIESKIAEGLFRLLSEPTYFPLMRNGNQIDWKTQRNMLFELVPTITYEDISKGNLEYESILQKIKSNTPEQYRDNLKKQEIPIKEELKKIPIRIDERIKSKPELYNWEELEEEKAIVLSYIKKVEEEKKDKQKAYNSANQERSEHMFKLSEMSRQIEDMKRENELKHENAVNEKKHEIKKQLGRIKNGKKELENEHEMKKGETLRLKEKLSQLTKEYRRLIASSYAISPDDINCPTCGKEWDNANERKAEIIHNFNNKKAENIKTNIQDGTKTRNEISIISVAIESIEMELGRLDTEEIKLQESLNTEESKPDQSTEPSEELTELMAKYEEAKKKTFSVEPITEEEQNEKLKGYNEDLTRINTKLDNRVKINEIDQRIAELKDQMRLKSNELSLIEKDKNIIDLLIREKIENEENNINQLFSFVKFKFYKDNINGSDEETCIILCNGVPYFSANYESRINAGLDIIKTFSHYKSKEVPVWIDNRESITKTIDMDSQVVNLVKKQGEDLHVVYI